ncbi:hypothetical protein DFH08DRAFT_885560 [Mycena albidolilacea]|uniref:Uncharacterized protein n=1 Tax=Mycena albidolilacea TaxID=1033008 RepID=A0AAD6ZK37_9AGAR|nr:hypothetical protein DFH08DRAFT_885560 [Mycena albidolilacea]
MPAITEQPVSALTSALPTKLLLAVFIVAAIANIIYYMLPMRLTHTLVALLAKAEETYIEAHGMCLLSAAETQMLAALQLQVATIREKSLQSSLSSRVTLRDFVHGRTFTLLRSIREVQKFETHIQILKESQLRTELISNPRGVLLRRRGVGPR